jgi:hypothetical protein
LWHCSWWGLCHFCAMHSHIGSVLCSVVWGQVRISLHHLQTGPSAKLLEDRQWRTRLNVPGCPGVPQAMPGKSSMFARARAFSHAFVRTLATGRSLCQTALKNYQVTASNFDQG